MTKYLDLTPISYPLDPPSGDLYGLGLAIGYLEADSNFDIADPNPDLLERLIRLTLSQKNVMRGWHTCQLCKPSLEKEEDGPLPFATSWAQTDLLPGELGYKLNGFIFLGFAELHVPGSNGEVFVASTLIVHYVQDHHYDPPESFKKALMSIPEKDLPNKPSR